MHTNPADDLGWADLGFRGSNVATPNIDELHHNSIEMREYHVQPVCSATRGALMESRFPLRIGAQHYVYRSGCDTGVPLNLTFLPQHLAQQGYRRHMV